jgi:hypothetical protein
MKYSLCLLPAASCLVLALLLAPATAGAQDPTARVMTAMRSALAPALPFPETDASGAVPKDNSTAALWMVRYPDPGETIVEVLANPLNEVNQLRATRAMAMIESNIEAAQRRATMQYERAVAEAKRTGKSQEVDGVTLSDEGVAGSRIDAESHVLIDVAINKPSYTTTVTSAVEPAPSRLVSIPGAVAVIAVPSNIYRDESGAEHFAEAETQIYLGRTSAPDVRKRADNTFEIASTATAADNLSAGSIVVRIRGNEGLMAEVLRKANWNALLELLK